MGLFGNSKKGKIVVATQKAGNGIKRVKFALGANVILAVIRALGWDAYIPAEMQAELANVIVSGVGLLLDWLAYRKSKPAPEPPAEPPAEG